MRTEQERVYQYFTVTFAGERHRIRVKPILMMDEFRAKLADLLAELAEAFREDIGAALAPNDDGSTPDMDEFISRVDQTGLIVRAIPFLVGKGLNALIEVLWAYLPEFREGANEYSDDEIVDAALGVLAVTFPLLRKLATSMIRFIGERARAAEAGTRAPMEI